MNQGITNMQEKYMNYPAYLMQADLYLKITLSIFLIVMTLCMIIFLYHYIKKNNN